MTVENFIRYYPHITQSRLTKVKCILETQIRRLSDLMSGAIMQSLLMSSTSVEPANWIIMLIFALWGTSSTGNNLGTSQGGCAPIILISIRNKLRFLITFSIIGENLSSFIQWCVLSKILMKILDGDDQWVSKFHVDYL